MNQDLIFYDAAYPPPHPPVTDGVCIYIGGDTPHVWTMDEIRAQTARYRLPVFVRSNPGTTQADACGDAAAAIAQLHAIGAPRGCLVAWDTETAADPGYMAAIWALLKLDGYQVLDYGSQSRVFGNTIPDGYYWGADWTGEKHLAAGDVMTQYASFTSYDLDEAVPSLPFWDTTPHPTHAASSIAPWEEEIVKQLPTIGQGATGTAVRTIQALCCARGHSTYIDGIFGPLTKAAVEAVQTGARIGVDGIVGPVTWPVLMGIE